MNPGTIRSGEAPWQVNVAAQHTLTIGETDRGWTTYIVDCTGPDEACRAWLPCPCENNPGYERELFQELLELEWDGWYHGVQHRWIEGEWMRPTDWCFVHNNPYMPDAAGELRDTLALPAGSYPVVVTWHGYAGEFIELSLAPRKEPE